jgi:beta-1,4-mannosyltransferase
MADDRRVSRPRLPRTVMFSVPPPSAKSNPYTTLLARSITDPRISVEYFSWKAALFGHVDVLHVHWPETLVRNANPVKRLARLLAGFAYLLKKRVVGSSIVWTVHNLRPHESSRGLEDLFLRAFYRSVDRAIYINESVENTDGAAATILHGTYGDWYGEVAVDETARRDVLFFGMVRPYKGLEDLIAAMSQDEATALGLTIMGDAADRPYADSLRTLAEHASNVKLDLLRVPDDQLASAVRSSTLVALPYRSMYNSGALLMALSLGTHVLAPKTPATDRLQAEFGERWVSLFSSPIDAGDIAAASAVARAVPKTERPDMTGRDWATIGRAHTRLYLEL